MQDMNVPIYAYYMVLPHFYKSLTSYCVSKAISVKKKSHGITRLLKHFAQCKWPHFLILPAESMTACLQHAKSRFSCDLAHLSRFMRKPDFCLCKNKDADW